MQNKAEKKHSLIGRIVRFVIPLMLTGILQLIYNAADGIIVGHYDGSKALAAVTSTGALINLILNAFLGLTVGASVAVAHDFGARDGRGVEKTVHTSVLVGIICGIIIGAIGIIYSGTFLKWMDTPDDVLSLATEYLASYFVGTPGMLVYNFCASILRSVGDTKRPLYFLSVSGIINVILNIIFVANLHMGVAGVAWATVISQYISLVLIIVYMTHLNDCCKIDFRKLRIHKDKLIKIIAVGLPAGLQGCVFSLSNVVIQSSINSFGSLVMAGNGAAQSLDGFIYTAMNSVSQASLTFIGQAVGAKEYDKINKVVLICASAVSVVGIVMGVVVVVFAAPLVGIYLPHDPEAVPYAVKRLVYCALPYFTCGIMEVMCGAQRGMGMSVIPMITSLVGSCVFRIVWIYPVFASVGTLEILYISYPISWTITSAVHTVFYSIKLHSLKKKAKLLQITE